MEIVKQSAFLLTLYLPFYLFLFLAWILWVSLAIMTSESIVNLFVLLSSQYTSSSSYAAMERAQEQHSPSATAKQYEPPWHLTPNSWIVSGLIISTVASTMLLSYLFNTGEVTTNATQVQIWVPLVGIMIAAALSVLAVRALGATDLNPVNALGKVRTIFFPRFQCQSTSH